MTPLQTHAIAREQIDKNMSADVIRRHFASKIMNFGDLEPPHVLTSNVIRCAKSRILSKDRIHNDPILGLCIMKHFNQSSGSIHDIGYDRFFCHYWSSLQLNVYREYVKNCNCPSISMDGTGGIVQKPTLIGSRKTRTICLYEIAFYNQVSKIQFSVAHMLSERHDNNSISHWLTEWLRDGAPLPKQVVRDMSLALLSGVVKAFTTFNTLWDYMKFCYHLCTETNGIYKMPCLIKCDVAHVIKLMTTWAVFKKAEKRVKQIVIHSLCKVLLASSLKDAMELLKVIFWTINSKFVGMMADRDEASLADIAQKSLMGINATGHLEQDTIQYIESNFCSDECNTFGENENDDNTNILYDSMSGEDDNDSSNNNSGCEEGDVNEDEVQALGVGWRVTARNQDNPFYMLVYNLALQCENEARQNDNGTTPNLHYLPEIVPHIVDLCGYLPL